MNDLPAGRSCFFDDTFNFERGETHETCDSHNQAF